MSEIFNDPILRARADLLNALANVEKDIIARYKWQQLADANMKVLAIKLYKIEHKCSLSEAHRQVTAYMEHNK